MPCWDTKQGAGRRAEDGLTKPKVTQKSCEEATWLLHKGANMNCQQLSKGDPGAQPNKRSGEQQGRQPPATDNGLFSFHLSQAPPSQGV